jgi:hypothetical protein
MFGILAHPAATIDALCGAIVAQAWLPNRVRCLAAPEENMNQIDPTWHVPVRVDDVPETGLHLDLVADEKVRAELAAFAGLRAVPKLEAALDVVREGDGLRASGRVSACVGQTCVVTLEPLDNDVDETFDVVFSPLAGDPEAAPGHGGEEPPERLADGVADIGAIVTEFFLLGIDRYPRKPGSVFATPTTEASEAGPFAALAKLQRKNGEP